MNQVEQGKKAVVIGAGFGGLALAIRLQSAGVATTLVDPGQTVTVQFRAPGQPGDYPYVCTFPAHWRVMNGVLHVVPRGQDTGPAADGALRR